MKDHRCSRCELLADVDHETEAQCIEKLKLVNASHIAIFDHKKEELSALEDAILQIARITGLGLCDLDRPTPGQLAKAIVRKMHEANPYRIKK